MKPLTLCASLLLLLPISARADSVDDLVKKEMDRLHIPGMSIAVLIKDKVVKIKGYGQSNVELNVRAKADTVYEIGSLTKQFTATAIMLLAEDGKLSPDDTISKYLPNTPDAWKDITVRNLLNHTSGIKSYTSFPEYPLQMKLDESKDSIFRLIASKPLDFAPGTQFQYSNSGYFLLGMIVESVSGEPYAQFLQDRMFRPVEMKATGLSDPNTLVPNRAAGYEWSGTQWKNAEYVSMSWPFAAGALVSSVEDFAKWASALYDRKLLKAESYAAMEAPAKLNDGTSDAYGFGWDLTPFRNHARISHTGGIPGFNTNITRWPDDDLTVIAFANCNCDIDEVAEAVSGLYVPAVKPLSLLSPQSDPDPGFTAHVRGLIEAFAKGDGKVDYATDAVKKLPDKVDNQHIFADISANITNLEYLDRDRPNAGGLRSVYYRIDRKDGVQFLVVAEDQDGKIAGVRAGPVFARS